MDSPYARTTRTSDPGRRLAMLAACLLAALFVGASASAAPQDAAALRILVSADAEVLGENAITVIQIAQDLPRELREILRSKGYRVVATPDKPHDVEVRFIVETDFHYAVVNAWVIFRKTTLQLVQDDRVLLSVDYDSPGRGGNFKTYGEEGAQYAKKAAADLADMMIRYPSFASIAREALANSPAGPSGRESDAVRKPREPALAAAAASDVDQLPGARAKRKKDAYAIVIGIEEYRQKLPRADFAANDAQTMAKYLVNVLGYPEENVITLINDRALKSDMEKYFEQWLTNNVEPHSSVFIYYSGHGAPDPKTGGAYLVPYDGDPTFIKQTGYPLKKMYDVLNKLQNRETIVALDSCFSGAGGRSVLAKGSRPLVMNLKTTAPLAKSITVLSASSGDQVSSSYDDKGHGLFTYFLLKGMKEEDVVEGGTLRVRDLFSYVKPQVSRISRKIYNNEQTPQLFQGSGGAEE